MKISRETFEKLISEYLDGEASPADAQRLLDCIKNSASARNFFLRTCAAHRTLCRLYGKRATFPKLASLDIEELLTFKAPSRLKIAMEWGVVACLFAMSAVLMCAALEVPSASANNADEDLLSDEYDISVARAPQADGEETSILRILPKRSVFILP